MIIYHYNQHLLYVAEYVIEGIIKVESAFILTQTDGHRPCSTEVNGKAIWIHFETSLLQEQPIKHHIF